MSTKTTLKVYFPRPYFQEIWDVLKAYLKMLPVWAGFMSDVHGEQLLVYLVYLRGKACVR